MLDTRKRWILRIVTDRGPRQRNDDACLGAEIPGRRGTTRLAIVADGIASSADGGAAARAAVAAARGVAEGWLRHIRRREFRRSDADDLARHLRRLPGVDVGIGAGTTFVLTLLRGRTLLVLWAGDSRAGLLDESSRFHYLTDDHHDEEGAIRRWYDGTGRLHGRLALKCVTLRHPPLAITLSSDGVHEACTETEMRSFLLYSIGARTEGPVLDREFGEFLRPNLKDNYTLAIWSRHPGSGRMASLARRGHPPP